MIKHLLLLLALISISGCSEIYSRIAYDFQKLDSSYSIYYEEGAEDIAERVEASLGELISNVEQRQYLPFKSVDEIEVYVFNNIERYANYSLASSKSRGSATKNEIFISPIIRERINTLESIVRHELSHIHIRQYIGTLRYINDVPGWFHEGLAVEISGGGGAERVTEEEAIDFLEEGKHFLPRTEGGLLKHKTAHDYGLKPHMYYRQSLMFVQYLIKTNPNSFRECYVGLVEGQSFESVWKLNYGKSLSELWVGFIGEI